MQHGRRDAVRAVLREPAPIPFPAPVASVAEPRARSSVPTHSSGSAPQTAPTASHSSAPPTAKTLPHWERGARAFLELYAGCGRLTGAVLDAGVRCGPAIEIDHGPEFDLHHPRVLRQVIRWIRQRRFFCLSFGTPCTFWSVATGRARGKHAEQGIQAAKITIRLIRELEKVNGFWVVENPASSALWSWPPMMKQIRRSRAAEVVLHMCAFGACYRKATQLAGTLPGLASLGRTCPGDHYHEQLRGTVKLLEGGKWVSKWRTTLANPYPPPLCRALAQLVRKAAPAVRTVDVRSDLQRWQAALFEARGCKGDFTPGPRPCCPRGCPRAWPADSAGWDTHVSWIPARPAGAARAGAQT